MFTLLLTVFLGLCVGAVVADLLFGPEQPATPTSDSSGQHWEPWRSWGTAARRGLINALHATRAWLGRVSEGAVRAARRASGAASSAARVVPDTRRSLTARRQALAQRSEAHARHVAHREQSRPGPLMSPQLQHVLDAPPRPPGPVGPLDPVDPWGPPTSPPLSPLTFGTTGATEWVDAPDPHTGRGTLSRSDTPAAWNVAEVAGSGERVGTPGGMESSTPAGTSEASEVPGPPISPAGPEPQPPGPASRPATFEVPVLRPKSPPAAEPAAPSPAPTKLPWGQPPEPGIAAMSAPPAEAPAAPPTPTAPGTSGSFEVPVLRPRPADTSDVDGLRRNGGAPVDDPTVEAPPESFEPLGRPPWDALVRGPRAPTNGPAPRTEAQPTGPPAHAQPRNRRGPGRRRGDRQPTGDPEWDEGVPAPVYVPLRRRLRSAAVLLALTGVFGVMTATLVLVLVAMAANALNNF